MFRKSLVVLVVVGALVGLLLLGGLGCGKSSSAPSVTTNDASNVTANSATLNGNLTSLGSASSVTVSFVWGTTSGGPYPNETTGQVTTNSGTFSFDLSGLTLGTTYYFEAKAVGTGTGFGAEKSFATTGSTGDITVTSSVTLGHTHQVTISGADIDNPPVGGRTITTTAYVDAYYNSHSHTITLTQQDFQTIKDGGTVTVTTNVVNGHTHTFTIHK